MQLREQIYPSLNPATDLPCPADARYISQALSIPQNLHTSPGVPRKTDTFILEFEQLHCITRNPNGTSLAGTML